MPFRRQRRAPMPAHVVLPPAALLHMDAAQAIALPTVPSDMVQDGAASIEFAAASVVDRIGLAALVAHHRPMRLFEIGTFRGVTAVTMAMNAPEGSVLYTLDLPPALDAATILATHYQAQPTTGYRDLAQTGTARDVGRLIGRYTGACRIEQVYGDSGTMDFGPYERSIDFFFIDGCHAYDNALRDTRIAWRCVRPGGLVVWHDYPWDDVQRAIHDARLGSPITTIAGSGLAFTVRP